MLLEAPFLNQGDESSPSRFDGLFASQVKCARIKLLFLGLFLMGYFSVDFQRGKMTNKGEFGETVHWGRKAPHFRKSLMSVIFLPAILGPQMAAPILWTPGIFWFFLLRTPHAHKFLVFFGGGGFGFFGQGGRSVNLFLSAREFFWICKGAKRSITQREGTKIEKNQTREAILKKSSFQYGMTFSIENGFTIRAPLWPQKARAGIGNFKREWKFQTKWNLEARMVPEAPQLWFF